MFPTMPYNKSKHVIENRCKEILDDMKTVCTPTICRNHFMLKLTQTPGIRDALKSFFALRDEDIALLSNLNAAALLENYGGGSDHVERYKTVELVAEEILNDIIEQQDMIKTGEAKICRTNKDWTLEVYWIETQCALQVGHVTASSCLFL